MLSLFVHAMALQTLLSVRPVDRLRDVDRVAGVAAPKAGYSIEPLTLVELDETADSASRWPEPPALAALPLPGRIELTLPQLDLSRSDDGDVEAVEETARASEPVPIPGSDRHTLFARYVEQIRARVDRAWEKPSMLASCVAEITQDSSGGVREVKLDGCDGDADWQQSLVTAIRRASPLPAPPVAQVFAERVSIEFATSR